MKLLQRLQRFALPSAICAVGWSLSPLWLHQCFRWELHVSNVSPREWCSWWVPGIFHSIYPWPHVLLLLLQEIVWFWNLQMYLLLQHNNSRSCAKNIWILQLLWPSLVELRSLQSSWHESGITSSTLAMLWLDVLSWLRLPNTCAQWPWN